MSAFTLIVVLAQHELSRSTSGRSAQARARARAAVLRSARLSGAGLGELAQDPRGAPVCSQGWHWSLSHAGAHVAGVVAQASVGVDIEPLGERRQELMDAVLDEREHELLGRHARTRSLAFVRAWTAKEAVLKKLGVGLSELSRCRIVAAPSPDRLELSHDGRAHQVHQLTLEGAVAAVSVDGPLEEVNWQRETGPWEET